MEELNQCPGCNKELVISNIAGDCRVAIVAKDTLVSGKQFKIERCGSCGLLFTNPRPGPAEISDYYKSEAYISHTENKRSLKDRIYLSVQKYTLGRKVALLKKHTKQNKGRLLDYGCGAGGFLNKATLSGYNTVGYEPDEKARKNAEDKGLNAKNKRSEVIGNDTEKYDIITLWHVLEHLHDFPSILNDFYTNLNSKGLLIIAVPIANSADAVYYGNDWAAWDLPRHLFHFTPDSLIRCCEEAGYELKKKKGMPFDSYYVSWLSEQNRGNKLAALNAFLIGSWSNLRALIGKTPWSSETFVFRKKQAGSTS